MCKKIKRNGKHMNERQETDGQIVTNKREVTKQKTYEQRSEEENEKQNIEREKECRKQGQKERRD
jgi:hypothetical protein